MGSVSSVLGFSLPITSRDLETADLPTVSPYRLGRARPTARYTYPSASPLRSSGLRWYRNINRLSIAYASRPRLRSRLTLSGRAFLRKPWACGGKDSHLPFRYSYRHSHFHTVHMSFRSCFDPYGTLPYHRFRSVVSVADFSPVGFSAQSHSTSELLRTL